MSRRFPKPVITTLVLPLSTAAFIVLANCWLAQTLLSSDVSFVTRMESPVWKSVLTTLCAIPQIPSLVIAKQLADTFQLSTAVWAATTAAISILIYCPMIYRLTITPR